MRCGARESRTCLGRGEWARRGDVRLEGCFSFTSCPKAALQPSKSNPGHPKLHLLTKRSGKKTEM